jgi:hypothetical protein
MQSAQAAAAKMSRIVLVGSPMAMVFCRLTVAIVAVVVKNPTTTCEERNNMSDRDNH